MSAIAGVLAGTMIVVRTHDGYSHMIHLEPDGSCLLCLEALSHKLGGGGTYRQDKGL